MPTYRCPVHDVLFEAQGAPSHLGHAKCHLCAKVLRGESLHETTDPKTAKKPEPAIDPALQPTA
jgi:hypothetical protein